MAEFRRGRMIRFVDGGTTFFEAVVGQIRFSWMSVRQVEDTESPLALTPDKFTVDDVHGYVNLDTMKRITFYTSASGRCPVQEHFDTLPDKTVQKIAWVLRLIRDLEHVPSQYLKKLVNTDDIWEVRVDVGRNTFRVLGFFCGCELIVLTNSFQKKTQKTTQGEISLAEERKADYLQRRKHHG